MLRFNDTARRELRSDTSLLRGDRDKPAENSYLEAMPTGKATTQLLGCCSTLGAGIFNVSEQGCLVWSHSRALLLSHALPRGVFPALFTLFPGTAGTDSLAHRCSFCESLVEAQRVQLC